MPGSASRRMPLSCEPCRTRKIRCPRNANGSKGPCETCVRRGVPADECIYLRDVLHQRRPLRPSEPGMDNATLLLRIRKLENLIGYTDDSDGDVQRGETDGESSDMPSVGASSVQPYPTPASMPASGKLSRSKSGHEHYEPSLSRWSSVLQNSPAVDDTATAIDEFNADAQFPFTATKARVEDLLSLLPPLSRCDALTDIYFDVFSPLFHVLHDPTFRADYALFRSKPEQTPFSWLALLFAVLSVAVTAMDETDDMLRDLGKCSDASSNLYSLTSAYRAAAFRCLEADHYLWRHNAYTLQALILIIYGINHSHGQSWALLGLTKNIAISLGCHIDPDNFSLGIVEAEQRRRGWAALTMLYTIQNTALGSIDPTPIETNVKLPLDVDDDELTGAITSPNTVRSSPSQMSYLLFKFRMYNICAQICKQLFSESGMPSFDVVSDLDAEISAQQDAWNSKYLSETRHKGLPDHHAVHLHILDGYSHQLFLLLHRPALIREHSGADGARQYTASEILFSQRRCIESARRLLNIHGILHKSDKFQPYQWYNRGLGSFHAFHAAVVIAYICETGSDLDTSEIMTLQQGLDDTIPVFEAMSSSGMSRLCRKSLPVLYELRKTVGRRVATRQARQASAGTLPGVRLESPASEERSGLPGTPSKSQTSDFLEAMIGNFQPQQWLSPSAIPWEWDFLTDGTDNLMGNAFG